MRLQPPDANKITHESKEKNWNNENFNSTDSPTVWWACDCAFCQMRPTFPSPVVVDDWKREWDRQLAFEWARRMRRNTKIVQMSSEMHSHSRHVARGLTETIGASESNVCIFRAYCSVRRARADRVTRQSVIVAEYIRVVDTLICMQCYAARSNGPL